MALGSHPAEPPGLADTAFRVVEAGQRVVLDRLDLARLDLERFVSLAVRSGVAVAASTVLLSGAWFAIMTQVLLNLISNAFTHSPDSSDVDVATQTDNGRIVIRIHNANRFGPIPSELLPVLFLPFKSGSARSGSPTRSIGLGLYIVDQIVKAHGGRVDVDSTDAGTTFTVTIDR